MLRSSQRVTVCKMSLHNACDVFSSIYRFLPISHRNFTKAVAELTMKPR